MSTTKNRRAVFQSTSGEERPVLREIAGIQTEQNEGQVQMQQVLKVMQAQMKDMHDALISPVVLQLPLREWKMGMEVKLVIIN